MDINAIEVAPNTPSDLDKFIQNQNLLIRLLYRTTRRHLTCFLFIYMIIVFLCLVLGLIMLSSIGVDEVYLVALVVSVVFSFAAFSTLLCSVFNKKEMIIRNLWIRENQQPMTDEEKEQFRRLTEEENRRTAQLKIDEENKQLQRLLEERKKLPTRGDNISPKHCGKKVVLPIVKEGSDTKVAGQLLSVQVHNLPVSSPESCDSSETSGRGQNTMAIPEKHDNSGTGEINDLALCSNDLDRISVIQMEEENSEELLTKSDELEQLEMKEFAGSSLLEERKYAKKSDSQSCGGEDRQSSLEESDAVNGMSLRNKNTASSYSPPRKRVRTTSV